MLWRGKMKTLFDLHHQTIVHAMHGDINHDLKLEVEPIKQVSFEDRVILQLDHGYLGRDLD